MYADSPVQLPAYDWCFLLVQLRFLPPTYSFELRNCNFWESCCMCEAVLLTMQDDINTESPSYKFMPKYQRWDKVIVLQVTSLCSQVLDQVPSQHKQVSSQVQSPSLWILSLKQVISTLLICQIYTTCETS